MNLSANRTRLERLTRDLLTRWNETCIHWRDGKSREFDRQYMQELAARVEKATGGLEKLDHLLREVQRDCE